MLRKLSISRAVGFPKQTGQNLTIVFMCKLSNLFDESSFIISQPQTMVLFFTVFVQNMKGVEDMDSSEATSIEASISKIYHKSSLHIHRRKMIYLYIFSVLCVCCKDFLELSSL